ncbi:hypothetical protein [Colwellia asteriadis]
MMKTKGMKLILSVVCVAVVFLSVNVEAKKRCRPLLEKLQNIQALQRSGYGLKKGQSLRAREDKARDKWWQCERSSSFKTKSKSKKKRSKAQGSSNKAKVIYKKSRSKKTKNVAAPFASKQRIEVKSKYPREKQFAWLHFYQRPERCHQPKSLTTFAFCSEDRLMQQAEFEHQYVEPAATD